ncbi:MAG: NusG domain II-containing protein [Peptococcaceae bacterium]
MKLKKGDILIVIILLIAMIGWLARDLIWPDTREKTAVIEVNGSIYQKISLSSGSKQEIQVNLPNNEYVQIIQDGELIYVAAASCPDKVCVKTGQISKIGQNIVCLPNRVVIYIEGKSQAKDIDDLSF